jgi:hypothetical protein
LLPDFAPEPVHAMGLGLLPFSSFPKPSIPVILSPIRFAARVFGPSERYGRTTQQPGLRNVRETSF